MTDCYCDRRLGSKLISLQKLTLVAELDSSVPSVGPGLGPTLRTDPSFGSLYSSSLVRWVVLVAHSGDSLCFLLLALCVCYNL